MSKKKTNGIGAAGKVAILLVLFGIPALFIFSSWGLSKLFDTAPYLILVVLALFSTAYTAKTVQLMYSYYGLNAPVGRFVPCLCEIYLTDVKYHLPCYIFYLLAIILAAASRLPYSVMKVFGDAIALNGSFYLVALAIIMLAIIQVIKGVGLMSCMKDISADWYKQTHAEIGAINSLMILSFIPFVRVIAIYAMNKPLSTMVDFMDVTVDDASDGDEFEEENEDEYEDEEEN